MSNDYGIPAFIPTELDTVVPEAVDGDHVTTCLTESLRAVAYTTAANTIVTVAYHRYLNYEAGRSEFSPGAGVVALHMAACGEHPTVVWLRVDGVIEYTTWNGSTWNVEDSMSSTAVAIDVVPVLNGCHVAWIENDPGVIHLGQFINGVPTSSYYAFGKTIGSGATLPTRAIAVDISPAGEILLAWHGAALTINVVVLSSYAAQLSANILTATAGVAQPTTGLAAVFRGLRNSEGNYPVVLYTSSSGDSVDIREVEATDAAITLHVTRIASPIPLARLESRAFRVGDEVFAWLRGMVSDTHFLIAGVTNALRCAIADREEAKERPPHDGTQACLADVGADPSDDYGRVWARLYDWGFSSYSRPGNARVGYLNFMPQMSTAKYGKSLYIAGSLVRNWDGKELGDAGFQDYPKISLTTPSAVGGSLPTGTYFFRVYAVRYNAKGERFQSVTNGSGSVAVTGPTGKVTLAISPVVITNHDTVQLEVYYNDGTGTAYRFGGAVANDRNASSVAFVASSPALGATDPYGPETGRELEEFGPTGCELVASAGDRLWCSGGQVPPGIVIFSKLYSVGKGAGFDILAGYSVVDAAAGSIVSIAAFSDAALTCFQGNQVWQFSGYGPSNLVGDNGFAAARQLVNDGAVSHWGTITLPVGIAYWGADGPRLLTPNGRVESISEPVVPLTRKLSPTGVKADLARREVVWYTRGGDAVLWNYAAVARTFDSGVMAAGSRWARWSNLPVAGLAAGQLVTTDGRLLTQASTPKDDGRRFQFVFGTGQIRPEQLLQDSARIRRVGLLGKYNGYHKAKFEIYYDGSPLWSERIVWSPADLTWLLTGTDFAALTPAQIDALDIQDKSGSYSTHFRVERQTCSYIRLMVSDGGDAGFTPWQLSFELGQKPGMGRTQVSTFTR